MDNRGYPMHAESYPKCKRIKQNHIFASCKPHFDCIRYRECVRGCRQSGGAALKNCGNNPKAHCLKHACSQKKTHLGK